MRHSLKGEGANRNNYPVKAAKPMDSVTESTEFQSSVKEVGQLVKVFAEQGCRGGSVS